MDNRTLAMVVAALAVLFLVLNFVTDAGTIFLILAVVAALLAGYLFSRPRP